MFYPYYTKVLTDKGFIEISELFNFYGTNTYKVAYLEEGNLKFTDNYKVNLELDNKLVTITDKNFISTTSDKTLSFYYKNENKLDRLSYTTFHSKLASRDNLLDPEIIKNTNPENFIYLSYKCFENMPIKDNLYSDIVFNELKLHLSYVDLLKVIILYISFGTKGSNSIKFKLDSNNEFIKFILIPIFNKGLGAIINISDNYIEINNSNLYKLLTEDLKETMEKVFYNEKVPNSSSYFCKALEFITKFFRHSKNSSISSLFATNKLFEEYLYIISACLVTNGYIIHYNRYKSYGNQICLLRYRKATRYNLLSRTINESNFNLRNYAYGVYLEEEKPLFICETRNYITNTIIRPSRAIKDESKYSFMPDIDLIPYNIMNSQSKKQSKPRKIRIEEILID